MKIQRIQVTLEPWLRLGALQEIHIYIKAGDKMYSFVESMPQNDFESNFDLLFEEAKRRIKTVIEQEQKR